MRLTGANEFEVLSEVWAYLTRLEIEELASHLAYLLEEEDDWEGWHCHVGPPGAELTIAFEV